MKLLPICSQYPDVLIEAAWDTVSSRFAFDLIGICVKLLTHYSSQHPTAHRCVNQGNMGQVSAVPVS